MRPAPSSPSFQSSVHRHSRHIGALLLRPRRPRRGLVTICRESRRPSWHRRPLRHSPSPTAATAPPLATRRSPASACCPASPRCYGLVGPRSRSPPAAPVVLTAAQRASQRPAPPARPPATASTFAAKHHRHARRIRRTGPPAPCAPHPVPAKGPWPMTCGPHAPGELERKINKNIN
nr:lysine-rich arabinogalactan protein 19-like [Aegilops tauschii subsp. strangulata]